MKTTIFQILRPVPAYIIACLLFVLFFAACKKGTSSGGHPNTVSSLVSSIRTYGSGSQILDSLTLDSAKRLYKIGYYGFDSSGGIAPVEDSLFYIFTIPPGASLPASYTFVYFQNGPQEDFHQLTFDQQNRILKDTSLSGTGYVGYYSYPPNEIAITVLYNGTFASSQTDTLNVSGGNIMAQRIYSPNAQGTADSLVADLDFGYGPYTNPAYDSTVSNSIGPLLLVTTTNAFGGYQDFISKNLASSITGFGNGLPPSGQATISPIDFINGNVSVAAESFAGQNTNTLVFTYYPLQ